MPATSAGAWGAGRTHVSGAVIRPSSIAARTAAALEGSIGIGQPARQHAPEWRQAYPRCVESQ
jgi:hypothetical protein